MSDEIVRLLLQVKGEDEVRDLRKATDDLRAELLKAMQAHKTFEEALKDPAVRMAAGDLRDMEKELARLEQALHSVGRSGFNSGQAMIQWSRALQDFQAAGFAGIVNNLELMASSIGAPAFVAGLVTIAGVFGPPLVRAIADFLDKLRDVPKEFDVTRGAVEKLKDEIKSLEEGVRLPIDVLQLDAAKAKLQELEEGAKAYQAALQGRSKAEVESGKAVRELFATTLEPGEQRDIVEQLGGARQRQMESLDEPLAELRRKMSDLEDTLRDGSLFEGRAGEALRARLQAELEDDRQKAMARRTELGRQARAQVGQTLKGATEGDAEAQAELADQMQAIGRGELAAGIGGLSPRQMKAQIEEEQALKEAPQAIQAARKMAEDLQKAVGEGGDAMERALGQFSKQEPAQRRLVLGAIAPGSGAAGVVSEADRAQRQAEQFEADEARRKEDEKREREMRRFDDEQERLLKERMRQAEREWDQAGREQAKQDRVEDKEDREAMREMDRQVTERNRLGRQALQAPGVRQQIERMLMQGGEPGEIAPEVGRFFEQQGLAPKGEGTFVGFGAAGQVQQDLQKRMANYTARGMDEIQAFAAVQEEILTEFVHMDQKLMHMEQSLMRQQGLMQGHRQTRLNRGEGF